MSNETQTATTTTEPVTSTTTETPSDQTSLIGAAPKVEGTETKPAEKKDAPAEFVPLTIQALTLPEGFEADTPLQEKFISLANELKISPEGANKLVALQAEINKAASERSSEAFATMQKQWQDEVRADPEIGGQNLEKNLAEINKLINSHGTPGLRQVLHLTGGGNNIEVLRFLTKISKELNEATPVSGQPAGRASGGGLADILYPVEGKTA